MTLLEDLSLEKLVERAKALHIKLPANVTQEEALEILREYEAKLVAQDIEVAKQDRMNSAARARMEGRHGAIQS